MAERIHRGPSTFRQRDIARAIRGAERAGHKVERVEIANDGRIAVILASEETLPARTGWGEDEGLL